MELKIGDKIYSRRYSSINDVEEIVRITKAYAFTKDNTKFHKLIDDNGYCKIIGGGIWSPSYWIETE